VSTEGVMATARGVVISHNANLLADYGDYIGIAKDWAKQILQKLNVKENESKGDAF